MVVLFAIGLYAVPNAFAYTISDDATGGDCSTIGTWDSDSKTCTLVENIVTGSGDGIIIDSDGIIFDGNSYVISGSGGGAGIFISAQNNIVVKNLEIQNYSDCVAISSSSSIVSMNNIIENNQLSCDTRGIYLDEPSATTIRNNVIENHSGDGISMSKSHNNDISQNIISNNVGTGIAIGSSNGNMIDGNTINNNLWNAIRIYSESNNNSLTNNQITSPTSVTTDGIYLLSGNNVVSSNTVTGFTGGNGRGINVNSNDNQILDNTVSSNRIGIATSGNNNNISGNVLNANSKYDIELSGTTNMITDNTLSSNSDILITGSYTTGTIVENNTWSNFDEPNDGCFDDNSNGFCDDPYVFSVSQDDTPKCTICELQPPADVIFPVIIVPNNITIQATNSTSSSVTFSVTATDDTDGNLNPSCTQSSGSNFPIGTTTVTCTVADVAGNSSSKSFTVTVLYDEPEPTVEEPIIENAISTTTIQNAQGSSVPGCEPDCYIPRIASVERNDVVTFENNDSAAHTTTSGTPSDGPNGIWDSSLMMKGQSFSIRLSDVGEYPYFCLVHPWMIGTILVVDGERVPQTGFVSVNESVYEIQYNSQNVEINSITADLDFISLEFKTEVKNPGGDISITFDRDFFDSRAGTNDENFFILADGNEINFSESKRGNLRTLSFSLSAGVEEIEIIGTILANNSFLKDQLDEQAQDEAAARIAEAEAAARIAEAEAAAKIAAAEAAATEAEAAAAEAASEQTTAELSVNEKIEITMDFTNDSDVQQPFALIVQIKDSNNTTISLSHVTGMLGGGQTLDQILSYTPTEPGTYTIEKFLWDNFADPTTLTDSKETFTLTVS